MYNKQRTELLSPNNHTFLIVHLFGEACWLINVVVEIMQNAMSLVIYSFLNLIEPWKAWHGPRDVQWKTETSHSLGHFINKLS